MAYDPTKRSLFMTVDRIVIILEVFAMALIGVLLQIPKIKNSPASKMLTLIYRIGFIMMGANTSGIAWELAVSTLGKGHVFMPWISGFFGPILILCILMVSWE
jgi:hypothetical protein